MTEREKNIERLLKRAESGAYDPQTDETLSEAAKFSSRRDRELERYRETYDDVKQHGGSRKTRSKARIGRSRSQKIHLKKACNFHS